MANKRISELTAASPLTGTEFLPVWQSGGARKATVDQLADLGLVGPEGPEGPQGPTGDDGADGAPGSGILGGSGPPDSELGANGDYYFDHLSTRLYGPKSAGSWGSGISLIGLTGATGPTGPAGGIGPQGGVGPTGPAGDDGVGVPGGGGDGQVLAKASAADYETEWIDPASGPIGPTGATGPAGADGADGTDGRTILSGTSNPTAGQGANGDFFINTATHQVFGPKTAGAWGTGTSLVGPAGADGTNGTNGADGATGPAGPGVATGGTTGQVLQKVSATNYDTTWATPTAGLSWPLTNTAASASDVQIAVKVTGDSGNRYELRADGSQYFLNGMLLTASGAAIKPIVVQGAASQTANLAEFQDSTGTAVGSVAANGRVAGSGGSFGTTSTYGAKLSLNTGGAANIGAVIRAAASQTGNLAEFQTSAGTVVGYVAPAGQYVGGDKRPFVTKTGAYTATDSDYSIWCDSTSSAYTISLPTAVGRTGVAFEIKDWKGTSATNNITIDPNGTETIDGALTKALNVAYMCLTVRSDGANWGIV